MYRACLLSFVALFLCFLTCSESKLFFESFKEIESKLTGEIVVKLHPNLDERLIKQLCKTHNLIYKGSMVGDHHIFSTHLGSSSVDMLNITERLQSTAGVGLVEPLYYLTRVHRIQEGRKNSTRQDDDLVFTDPYYDAQWHLHNNQGKDVLDLNVKNVWKKNIRGQGVTIAIVDDGLDWKHLDFENYAREGSVDINGNDPDPRPSGSDSHGTAAAGVAAAKDNNACGVGVAHRARVAGIRLLGGPTTDRQEASGLSFGCRDVNHIYSCSWGPTDDGKTWEGPGTLTRAAMEDCIKNGRGGLGTVYVWAGGNGRRNNDNANHDGYVNSRYTIGIGAMTFFGKQAEYSESGSCLFAVAPSSGQGYGIFTTGLNSNCNSHFGGTSAASPGAAGVVALVLQANPNLTWRDVQHIIVHSSKKIGPDAEWATNGAGLRVSEGYGFGLLDADAAVQMASSWVNVPPERQYSTGNKALSSLGAYSADTLTWTVSEQDLEGKTSFSLETVTLSISLTSKGGRRGDMEIVLHSPMGTDSTLQKSHDAGWSNRIEWTYSTVKCWGETPIGTWTLRIRNLGSGQATVDAARLSFYGHLPSKS